MNFGAKPVGTATPQFSFGGAQTSTPAKSAGLLGTSSVIGGGLSTTQVQSAGTLFGATPSAAPTSSLFGGAAKQPLTNTSVATGGLFTATATPAAAPAGGLFNFNKTTTTTPAAGASLFGSGAATTTTSLFGQPTAQQQPVLQQPAMDAMLGSQVASLIHDTVLQYLPALMQSVQQAQLYGDERDNMITSLNQLMAASGAPAAQLYWHAQQPPLPLSNEQPFNRFVTIVYHASTTATDADGLVALTVKGRSVQELNTQKQLFIDSLAGVLGNRPTLKIIVETVKPLTSDT